MENETAAALDNEAMQLPTPVPEIPVVNVDDAATYYADTLGFTLDWGGDAGGIGGVSRDGCRLFLVKRPAEPVTFWLNLSSKREVDELHREWSASGATIVSPPEDKPWGLREFTVADLDRNRIRVFYDFGSEDRV